MAYNPLLLLAHGIRILDRRPHGQAVECLTNTYREPRKSNEVLRYGGELFSELRDGRYAVSTRLEALTSSKEVRIELGLRTNSTTVGTSVGVVRSPQSQLHYSSEIVKNGRLELEAFSRKIDQGVVTYVSVVILARWLHP